MRKRPKNDGKGSVASCYDLELYILELGVFFVSPHHSGRSTSTAVH